MDDDEACLFDLTASLRRAGLACGSASNGWKALESMMRGAVPSVLVTDIRMPELDGLELAQRLMRMDVPKLPEIVFISGHAALGDAVKAMRLRARDLLAKPIDLRRLIQIVKEIQLERHALHRFAGSDALHKQTESGRVTRAKCIDFRSMSSLVLKNLRNLERLRSEHLPPGLAREATWEILLDLYVSEHCGDAVYLTAVGAAAGVAMTSALRRIHELEEKGMIARTPDEKDRRRAALCLTDKGRSAVQSFINSYITSLRSEEHQMQVEYPSPQDRNQ